MLKYSRTRTRQPHSAVQIDWSNPLAKQLAGGGFAGINTSVRDGLAFSKTVSVGNCGLCVLGGAGNYFACQSQSGIVGRTSGGTIHTHHHTVIIVAENVGNGFIYDSQSDGNSDHDIKIVGGKFFWAQNAFDMFSAAAPTVPTTGRVVIAAYSGQQSGAQPDVWINDTVYVGSNASQDSWITPKYRTFFGSSAYPNSNMFSGKGYAALVVKGKLTTGVIRLLSENIWQILKPRSLILASVVTAQFLRPISDVSNSGWTPSTGTDLFAMIGETVRNDATYISATTVGAICEVLLGTSTGDPLSSINHLPRIVMSAGTGGIIVRLKQGATVIKAWTYASLTGTDTLYEPTLTSGEIDSITDYTDLRLQLETTA